MGKRSGQFYQGKSFRGKRHNDNKNNETKEGNNSGEQSGATCLPCARHCELIIIIHYVDGFTSVFTFEILQRCWGCSDVKIVYGTSFFFSSLVHFLSFSFAHCFASLSFLFSFLSSS